MVPDGFVSLRWKLLAFALAVAFAFVGTAWVVGNAIVQPRFADIERREANEDLARVAEAISRDAEVLAQSAQDYGGWDDTLDFVATLNPEYVAANLVADTLVNLDADALLFRDASGRILWAKRLDPASSELIDDAELVAGFEAPALRLFEHREPTSRMSGIVMTPRGPALVGSAPITDSLRRTPPAGAVLFARLLDAEAIASLTERTRISFTLAPLGELAGADAEAATALERDGGTWQDSSNEKTLAAYAFVRDVRNDPVLLARATLPRDTSTQARAASRLTLLASTASGFVLLGVMWLVLARFVVRPLERVTAHAVRVGETDDLGARLALAPRDEIGQLACEFDDMVARLEASRSQLLDGARDAGRSEIARTVLHDIGNVLNSVVVSANVASECVARSEVASLRQVTDLLRGNAERLAEFFAADPRGQHVLPFLDELASALESERAHALDELKTLSAAVEHISALVRNQNALAQRSTEVLELRDPTEVAEQAIAFVADSFFRHGVALERRFAPCERIQLDRHRCIQVLVNLLENAKHATCEAARGRGPVSLAVSPVSDAEGDWICFTVADDGVGIDADDLARIFSAGYSTRSTGSGIGLHSSANFAREMGGALNAASPGKGHGATFTLRLPARRGAR